MKTLPYVPSYASKLSVEPRNKVSNFGGSYKLRVADGLNSLPRRWSLQFKGLSKDDAEGLRAFLEEHAGTTPFLFQIPGTEFEVADEVFFVADGTKKRAPLRKEVVRKEIIGGKTFSSSYLDVNLMPTAFAAAGVANVVASKQITPEGTTTASEITVGPTSTTDRVTTSCNFQQYVGSVEIGFWIKKISKSGVLRFYNPYSTNAGECFLDLAKVDDGWVWIDKKHPALAQSRRWTSYRYYDYKASFLNLTITNRDSNETLSFLIDNLTIVPGFEVPRHPSRNLYTNQVVNFVWSNAKVVSALPGSWSYSWKPISSNGSRRLYDKPRTQRAKMTQYPHASSWTLKGATIMAPTAGSVDAAGESTYMRLVEDASTGLHEFKQTISDAPDSTISVFSCLIYGNARNSFRVEVTNKAGDVYGIEVNTTTSAISNPVGSPISATTELISPVTNPEIYCYPNAGYSVRVKIAFDTKAGVTTPQFRLTALDAGGNSSYAGLNGSDYSAVFSEIQWEEAYDKSNPQPTEYIMNPTSKSITVGPEIVGNFALRFSDTIDDKSVVKNIHSPKRFLYPWNRKNLMTYSVVSNTMGWSSSSAGTGIAPVVTGGQAGPFGGTEGTRLQLNLNGGTTSGDYSRHCHSTASFDAGRHTLSFWAKKASQDAGSVFLSVDAVSGVSDIIEVTARWRKYIVHYDFSACSLSYFFFTVRGTYGTDNAVDVIVDKPMIEFADFAGEYIPNPGATANPQADYTLDRDTWVNFPVAPPLGTMASWFGGGAEVAQVVAPGPYDLSYDEYDRYSMSIEVEEDFS